MHSVLDYQEEPLRFVQESFPWGVPGSALKDVKGLHPHQIAVLENWRRFMQREHLPHQTVADLLVHKQAVASGHGAGLTTLGALAALWFVSCMPLARVILVGGTEAQTIMLATILHDYYMLLDPARDLHRRYDGRVASATMWGDIEAVPAYAHIWKAMLANHWFNYDRPCLVIIDQASAVPEDVWNLAEKVVNGSRCGLMLAMGQPLKSTGPFAACWRSPEWTTHHVDIRKLPNIAQSVIERWQDEWGEDSDLFRTRVRGEFPAEA